MTEITIKANTRTLTRQLNELLKLINYLITQMRLKNF